MAQRNGTILTGGAMTAPSV